MFKGLGNLANLGAMVKQAQQMGSRLQGINEELKTKRATGSSGGGMVTVEVSGIGEVLTCRIDPSLTSSGDRELLEDLIPAAVNQALDKAKELHAEAMRAMTQGLDMPDFKDMLDQLQRPDPDAPPSQP